MGTWSPSCLPSAAVENDVGVIWEKESSCRGARYRRGNGLGLVFEGLEPRFVPSPSIRSPSLSIDKETEPLLVFISSRIPQLTQMKKVARVCRA